MVATTISAPIATPARSRGANGGTYNFRKQPIRPISDAEVVSSDDQKPRPVSLLSSMLSDHASPPRLEFIGGGRSGSSTPSTTVASPKANDTHDPVSILRRSSIGSDAEPFHLPLARVTSAVLKDQVPPPNAHRPGALKFAVATHRPDTERHVVPLPVDDSEGDDGMTDAGYEEDSEAVTDGSDETAWLDVTASEVTTERAKIVAGDTNLEQATEILIQSDLQSLLVETGAGYGLFDFADLNTVLLLVLTASSQGSFDHLDDRSCEIVSCLKRGVRLGVGTVCDISGKNPCTTFPPDTPLRQLLPLFASGVHRVVITSNPPTILGSSALLEYLTKQPPPLLRLPLSEVDLPLHPLVSLPTTASVLDAMQVMSLNGMSALGVIGNDSDRDPELSSLVGIVTVSDCSKLVVPSEGKHALGMSLGDMCKNVLADHHGRERGEERVPVHTITPSTTLLHASRLILATSSSRVFMRTNPGESPPLSPVSSPGQISPPPSPSASSKSIGLPAPPPTQLSPQYVISSLDILSCLARSCPGRLTPIEPDSVAESWDMLPDSISKRRRRASSSAFTGFETWRWAEPPTPL
ncbi:hypothetical protein Q8F55_003681 [Vanrija albida]|uniref:CBS domain-containing protein n=1 Tax=Vanrija albida TaxID=181172 RepID=A0ABR3Q4W7_9TREE